MANPTIEIADNHVFRLSGFPKLISSHEMEVRLWDRTTGARHFALIDEYAQEFNIVDIARPHYHPTSMGQWLRFKLRGNSILRGSGKLRDGAYAMRVKPMLPGNDKPTNIFFFRVVNGSTNQDEQDLKLQQALQIDPAGADLFLDFYEPAFGEKITSDDEFKVDEIVPVEEGSLARVCLRNADGKLICYIPCLYERSFTIRDLVKQSGHTVMFNATAREYIDFDTHDLKPGGYKLSIVVDTGERTMRTRDHVFQISSQRDQSAPAKRIYCTLPWRDLTLREHGSMPCCDLNRNEHLLYNVHTDEPYDPWNNQSWKSIRQALVEGNPKYCNPKCPNLRAEAPETLKKFVKEGLHPTEADRARYEAYLNGDVDLDVGPSRLSVMVGTVCNIDCIFCPIPFLRNDRTILTESKLSLLKKHLPHARVLAFTGGEPLVYLKELRQLEPIFHKDLKLQVITNGIAAEKLIDFGTQSDLYVRVSINVASRESYQYLHEKDFFDRVVENMRALKKGRPKAVLSPKFIVMKSTAKEILDFAKLCIDVGADECCYTTLWLKDQSKIDPSEKILAEDPEWHIADEALAEAKQLLSNHGVKFLFSGWEKRPDDPVANGRAVVAEGDDLFEWAEG